MSKPSQRPPVRSQCAIGLLLAAILLAVAPTAAQAVVGDREPDPVGVWPLWPEPDVVRGFDPPDDPFGAGHRGVDLTGSISQPVRAAMVGSITYAGRLAGRGVVVVDHGSTRTTYEPVTAAVHVGDTVTAGDLIGTLELAGSHCFPAACLHWGWRRGDTYLDPLDLVGQQPVRLLPLGEPFAATRPVLVPNPWSAWLPLLPWADALR